MQPGSPYPDEALDDLPSVPADPRRDAHGVDLWCAGTTAIDKLDLDAACLVMQPDEHSRFARYGLDSSRRLYAAGRMLVRLALSRYVHVPPAAWRFGHNEHGKPLLTGPPGTPALHFNLTHTAGLAVCAVSMVHARIGVDAESLQRRIDATAIATQHFSAAEAQRLRALPPPRLAPEFLALWTLKESYLKARGEGLALPLASCSFELSTDGVRPVFDARQADTAPAWRFALLRSASSHVVALAAHTGGSPLQLRTAQLATLSP
jgi:4'-phosphopantetheinyl transferase